MFSTFHTFIFTIFFFALLVQSAPIALPMPLQQLRASAAARELQPLNSIPAYIKRRGPVPNQDSSHIWAKRLNLAKITTQFPVDSDKNIGITTPVAVAS